MKEKIYTIPVNDAFHADCECPVCYMEKVLETDAITYVMGPSYMEDDVRTVTNELGFCSNHVEVLSKQKNILGLALMLQTHIDKVNKDLRKLTPAKNNGGLFKKKVEPTALVDYIKKLEYSCYICKKVQSTMAHYMDTVFMLWDKEEEFQQKFKNSKGFCIKHYGLLYEQSHAKLSSKKLELFLEDLNHVYFNNMERITEDLDWFVKKFDYKYQNEPWKNSKDAVQRTITKTNSKII